MAQIEIAMKDDLRGRHLPTGRLAKLSLAAAKAVEPLLASLRRPDHATKGLSESDTVSDQSSELRINRSKIEARSVGMARDLTRCKLTH